MVFDIVRPSVTDMPRAAAIIWVDWGGNWAYALFVSVLAIGTFVRLAFPFTVIASGPSLLNELCPCCLPPLSPPNLILRKDRRGRWFQSCPPSPPVSIVVGYDRRGTGGGGGHGGVLVRGSVAPWFRVCVSLSLSLCANQPVAGQPSGSNCPGCFLHLGTTPHGDSLCPRGRAPPPPDPASRARERREAMAPMAYHGGRRSGNCRVCFGYCTAGKGGREEMARWLDDAATVARGQPAPPRTRVSNERTDGLRFIV